MEKALTFNLLRYAPVLKNHGVQFDEQEDYLCSKQPAGCLQQWTLYLSVRTCDTISLLNCILPVLHDAKIHFRIIKNQLLQYRLNAGVYGENEIGKVISIYPESADFAITLADVLHRLTASFKGPVVPSALRIGKILYTENPAPGTQTPFHIEKQYKINKKRPVFLGKYYIPVQVIKNSYKGDIYKAISVKKLAFKVCLIKQGKPVALDDQYEREMKDRLLWQKTVLHDLEEVVMTPAYIDFFEEKEHTYLVMQYAEGTTLFKTVKDLYQDKSWNGISVSGRKQLLLLFINAVNIVQTIHRKGYVQRDISDSNFLVLTDGRLCIIDFELSYSITKQEPAFPFLLGTYGYMPPEQIGYAKPDYKEDIYALGALLCFMLSNTPPINFITADLQKVSSSLIKITGDRPMVKMIMRCLSPQQSERPSLLHIKEIVLTHLHQL